MFSHCFPIGSDSDDDFARIGIPVERRTLVRYAVDVDFFQEQGDHWLPPFRPKPWCCSGAARSPP
jgi:hypothetical protein